MPPLYTYENEMDTPFLLFMGGNERRSGSAAFPFNVGNSMLMSFIFAPSHLKSKLDADKWAVKIKVVKLVVVI